MQVLKDPSKSTSDKTGVGYKYEEMSSLNLPLSSNPTDFFKKFGIDTSNFPTDWSYDDLKNIPTLWNNLKHEVAKNDFFDENAKKSIISSSIDEIGVQKVTYLIDDNEDFETILKNLNEQSTNAIFRAVTSNNEEREITVYTSRFGIWKDPNNVYKAKQNTGSESNGQIRYTFTARGQKDINSLVNIDKGFNYSVYEDIENLFDKNLINNINGNISKLHLKVNLTDEEMQEASIKNEAIKEVAKEVSHTNKEVKPTNAKTSEMVDTLEKNETEIRSTDEREIIIEKTSNIEEYESGRVEVINGFMEKVLKDLEERQALEKAILQEKINSIMQNRAKLKQDAILLLQNGMSLTDMNTELLAKKYNDLQIQIINEEFKKEIIDSVAKEQELKQVSKDLVVYVKKSEELENSKNYFKEQLKLNQKNFGEEVQKHNLTKVQFMNTIKLLEKTNEDFSNQKQYFSGTINDLKEEKSQLEKELEIIEAEIEEKIEIIDEQKETIHKKDENILLLSQTINQKDEKINQKDEIIKEKIEIIDEQKQTINQKDEKIEKLFETNSDLKAEIATANEKLVNLVEQIEKERKHNSAVIQTLKNKNNQLFEENTALREQLQDYIELKKELENYKRNASINSGLKEKVGEIKEKVSKDEEIVKEVTGTDYFKSKLENVENKDYKFSFNDERKSNNNNNNQ